MANTATRTKSRPTTVRVTPGRDPIRATVIAPVRSTPLKGQAPVVPPPKKMTTVPPLPNPPPPLRRRPIIGQIIIALMIIAAVAFGATRATQTILHGVSIPSTPPTVQPTPPPTPTAPALTTSRLSLGATQSFQGVALTANNLHLVTSNGFVGAPAGQQFAIISVTLVNLDPSLAIPYNAGDFSLASSSQQIDPQVFAALDTPLGEGMIPPHGRVQGTLAFLVPIFAQPTISDPLLVYLPSLRAGMLIAWSVPVAPTNP